MTVVAPVRERRVPVVRRFVRSPKGTLLIVLALLVGVAASYLGLSHVLPSLVGAILTAALVDVAIVRWTRGIWFFPSGAILSGLIVALVLSPDEPFYVPVVTAGVAVGSKYLFRTRWSNVFNPAALALIVAYFAFGSGESWWGSLPDLAAPFVVVLLGAGLFMADRCNKLPMVLVFLGSYFGLFTLSAFLGDPSRVAEVYRSPDVNAALFFAFFMLDDPPTSPVRYADQVLYSIIVAVVSFAAFETLGAEYFLLAGVLVGNAWESLRRLEENTKPQAAPA
jgi:Na+-translocating ferredoxin:NAD+ oxidoreductase RnfD subunit